jgi:hypothetical protein
MKTLLFALLLTMSIRGSDLPVRHGHCVAIRYPASASDLPNFYRAIQALSANPLLNETAVAIV